MKRIAGILLITIIILFSVFTYSCSMNNQVESNIRIFYDYPCWMDENTLIYARHENRLSTTDGDDYGKFYRSLTVYKFNLTTLTETEIYKVEWDDVDSTEWLYGLYAVNDTVFIDLEHKIYIPKTTNELQMTNIGNLINKKYIIRFSDDGQTVFYSDSNNLHRINRNGSNKEYIGRAPIYEVVDFYETSAGVIIVSKSRSWQYVHLIDGYETTPINNYDIDLVWWIELGNCELREVDLNNPLDINYYIDDIGNEVFEFTAMDRNTNNYGLCKLDVSKWETDTIEFYNELIGRRSPYKDKFILYFEEGFAVYDSLKNVYILREKLEYDE